MSISLDKLRLLRRQAGDRPAGPATRPATAIDSAAAPSPPQADEGAAAPTVAASAIDWVEQIQHKPVATAAMTTATGAVSAAIPGSTPARPAPRPHAAAAAAAPSAIAWVEQIQHKAQATRPAATAVAAVAAVASVGPAVAPAAPAGGRRSHDGAALRRLLGLRDRAAGRAPAPPRPDAQDRQLPGEEIAPGLFLIESFLPQPIPAEPLSLAFARREDAKLAARDLLFFDTETTGLAGGTGTRAFMIGAADWHHHERLGDGLRIRQLLIGTMAAETAMLHEFARWLQPQTVLSSYNGRCYDAPLLKTRYRLARQADPISALDHVDLLFPTRRRYRGVWENCRLATIERQLLRIIREDDLPGAEAPAAWLGYLRGGSARNLHRVGEHNHQDVVTLAQLFLRLVEVERAEREAG